MELSGMALAPSEAALLEVIRHIKFIAFDFDGVFTDNLVYVFEDGREAVRCSRSDGIGLSAIHSLGIGTAIISTEVNPVVQMRAKKLKIACANGCDDKRAALDQFLSEQGLSPSQAAFLGNDVNDLPCLEIVGLAIIVADAHPQVHSCAHYRTAAKGGAGAVREVCDLFVRAYTESGSVLPS